MAYFVTENNDQLRIDKGGNIFINGKCTNLKSDAPLGVQEHGQYSMGIALGTCKEGMAVNVTGHVPVFEYGHTRDEKGNPICTTVNTGHEAW